MIHCYQLPVKQELQLTSSGGSSSAMHQSQQSAPFAQAYVVGANYNEQALQQQQSDQSHSNQIQQQARLCPTGGTSEQQRAAIFSQQRRSPHESSQTNSNQLARAANSAAAAPTTIAGDDNRATTKLANQISPTKGDGQQRPTLIETNGHLNHHRNSSANDGLDFKQQQSQQHSTIELYDRLYGGRLVEDEHLEASLQEDWTSHLHGFDFGALHQQSQEHDGSQQAYRQQQHQQHSYNSNQQVSAANPMSHDDCKQTHDFNNNNNNNNTELDTTSTLSFAPLMPIVDTNQQDQKEQAQPTSNSSYYQTYQAGEHHNHQQVAPDQYLQHRMSPTANKQSSSSVAFSHQYHYTPAAPAQQQQQQQPHQDYDESQQQQQQQETSFQEYYNYANFETTSASDQQRREYHTFDTPSYTQQAQEHTHFRSDDCSPLTDGANSCYAQSQLHQVNNQMMSQQHQQQQQHHQSFSDHNHLLLVSSSSSFSPSSSSSSLQSSSSSPASTSSASSTSSAENHPIRPVAMTVPTTTPTTQNQTGGGAIKTLMKSLTAGCGTSAGNGASARSRRGRPRKKGVNAKGKVSGKLWEFIRDLLLSERTNPSFIRWERREDGVFKFVQSDKVAKMWGERKQNPKMTYEKLSRAMRYYYKSKVLLPVFGRRLVYKFGPNATGWMPALAVVSAGQQPQPPPPSSSSSTLGSELGGPVAPSTMTLVYHHHHHHHQTEAATTTNGQPHTIHYHGSSDHLHHSSSSNNNNHPQQLQQQTGQLISDAPTSATILRQAHEEIIY